MEDSQEGVFQGRLPVIGEPIIYASQVPHLPSTITLASEQKHIDLIS
jgi:hypothetical protein